MIASQLANWGRQEIDARNAELRFRARYRGKVEARAARLPESVSRAILGGWDEMYPVSDVACTSREVAAANAYALDMVRGFGASRVAAAYDEERIRDHASNYSMLCAGMSSLTACRLFGAGMGIEPPKARGMTEAGERARWIDVHWWRRQLRKAWTRRSDEGQRAIGLIRRGRMPYASDEAVEHRAARQQSAREWMSERVMVNEAGEQLELLELHKHSLSNPALRRGEFMCRLRGFEELAKELGHVALFWTLTTPSRFHAQRAGGGLNPNWDAADKPTPKEAQRWLCKAWQRARAKLARLSILYYGFRVAEPHHDGTPHWHMVLFLPADAVGTMQHVMRGFWLSDMGDEPGAAEHRCKSITIDPEQGSAAGYVAKYVAKNIDAAGAIGDEVSDETGAPVREGVQRVAAWASTHGIRQFQQVGGPPVGLWREARRLREPVAPVLLESVRAPASAKRGNWREFIGALGGIERARRRVSSVRGKYSRELRRPMVRYRGGPRGGWRPRPAEDHEMPAAWLDREEPRALDVAGRDVFAATRYGEQAAPRPAGLCGLGLLGRYVAIDTRPHRWRIEKRHESGQVVAGTGSHGPGVAGIHARNGARCADRAGRIHDGGAEIRGGAGSLSAGDRFSERVARSGSDLGPVAITVRDGGGPALGEPAAWTSRETSMAGPEWLH